MAMSDDDNGQMQHHPDGVQRAECAQFTKWIMNISVCAQQKIQLYASSANSVILLPSRFRKWSEYIQVRWLISRTYIQNTNAQRSENKTKHNNSKNMHTTKH